jgi:hypothetical protein
MAELYFHIIIGLFIEIIFIRNIIKAGGSNFPDDQGNLLRRYGAQIENVWYFQFVFFAIWIRFCLYHSSLPMNRANSLIFRYHRKGV